MNRNMDYHTDISTEELRLLTMQDSDLLLIDLRDRNKYLSGHIKGAESFPMKPTRLERLLKKHALRKLLGPDLDRPIAFY